MTNLEDLYISDTYKGLLHSSGAELPAVGQARMYDGAGNQSAISIGRDCNGVSICGTLSASNISLGGVPLFIDYIYPVGAIYLSIDNNNPQTRFQGTTWQRVSEGRFIAGVGEGTDKNAIDMSVEEGSSNDTIGEYSHTLNISETPSHTHLVAAPLSPEVASSSTTAIAVNSNQVSGNNDYGLASTTATPNTGRTTSSGSGASHNNVPPYFGVYIWRRTA